MSKSHVQARRDRLRAIAEQDRANRCTFCHRQLPKTGVVIVIRPDGQEAKFCDEFCEADQKDALQTMEARR